MGYLKHEANSHLFPHTSIEDKNNKKKHKSEYKNSKKRTKNKTTLNLQSLIKKH